MMANILIIDDNIRLCEMLAKALKKKDMAVDFCLTLKQGLKQLFSGEIDVVFLDVNLPDGNGLEAIPKIKTHPSKPEVIVITGHGDPDGAGIAIQSGVWDYIPKGGSHKDFERSLDRALAYRNRQKKTDQTKSLDRSKIIGESQLIKNCLEKLFRAAKSDVPVLIKGETGTGKELFSKAIHQNSPFRQNDFIVVDCAALPENLAESVLFGHTKGAFTSADSDKFGLIQLADKGTLFLDEIGDLSLPLQKKFLRVLQEKRFRPIGSKKEMVCDFRLISATHRSLKKMVNNGEFRQDLYFRINSIVMELPPLKRRKTDIPILARHFIEQNNKKNVGLPYRETAEFMKELLVYAWPGNIRELNSAINYACADCYGGGELVPKHLPDHIRKFNINVKLDIHKNSEKPQPFRHPIPFPGTNFKTFVDMQKKEYFEQLISHTGGDVRTACEISGLSKGHLYSLLRKYHIFHSSGV